MQTRSTTLMLAGVALLALAAAACDHATQPTQPKPMLSRAEADTMAQELTTDVDLLSSSLTYSPTAAPLVADVAGPTPAPALSSPCPAVTPMPPTNSDGDPVPDSVQLNFAGCSFSGPEYTVSLSGTIDVVDPTRTVTDHAIKWVFTDFTRSITENASGRTRSVKQNGTRLVELSADMLTHAETNFRTDYTFADGSTASHVRNWTSTFTADVAGSIQPDTPLPSGTWSIDGTSTWTRGTRSYQLMVSTNPDLHYNAACTVRPKFDSGTLHVQVTRTNGTETQQMTVTIQFTACGQYTVTRS